jgi:hypothetical protein
MSSHPGIWAVMSFGQTTAKAAREIKPVPGRCVPIIARTRNTCYKLEVSLKMNDDDMIITSGESELKTKTATGIGRFLTQKFIRVKKFEKLIQHSVHWTNYTTLRNNVSSNAMLTDIYTRRYDAFYRFAVVGRADRLPTPANFWRWFNDRGNEIA